MLGGDEGSGEGVEGVIEDARGDRRAGNDGVCSLGEGGPVGSIGEGTQAEAS